LATADEPSMSTSAIIAMESLHGFDPERQQEGAFLELEFPSV
jgi:hypothetical protein